MLSRTHQATIDRLSAALARHCDPKTLDALGEDLMYTAIAMDEQATEDARRSPRLTLDRALIGALATTIADRA